MMPLGQQEISGSQDGLFGSLALLACAIFLSKLWLNDLRGNSSKAEGALPGATPCSPATIRIAVLGALILLALETAGEKVTGLDKAQSTIQAHFLLAMIAASFLEELVFRGYLCIQDRGQKMLVTSTVGFSIVFALAHPYLWTFQKVDTGSWLGGVALHLDSSKAWFTTIALFLKSLWFYRVRFASWNPRHSLLPCMAAHLSINLGAFVIKAVQGHVTLS